MLLSATIDSLGQINTIVNLIKQHSPDMVEHLFVEQRIGTHIRHVHDHFKALHAGRTSGTVDYNRRSRNSQAETNIAICEEEHQWLLAAMSDAVPRNFALRVISEIDCFERKNTEISSNLDRELLYLINHTIHHVAIIKLILEHHKIDVPAYIGLAPGTATYLRQLNESAKSCAQ